MNAPLRPGALLWLLTTLLIPATATATEPLDFPLTTLSGEQQQLSDYRGRWVIVNYWATWCPPCRKEMPELDLFHENHHETDAVVLGINYEKISDEELRQFIDKQFLSFPMYRQPVNHATPFGRLNGLPTTFVISPDGVPVAVETGGITADMLEHFIANYPLPEDDNSDTKTASKDSEPTTE